MSGIVIFLDHTPIAWRSAFQSTVRLFVAEAEFISASQAIQDIRWRRVMLCETRRPIHTPISLYVDSQSLFLIASFTSPTSRQKYIDTRYHFLLNAVRELLIHVMHIPSRHMLAEIKTKPRKPPCFHSLTPHLCRSLLSRAVGKAVATLKDATSHNFTAFALSLRRAHMSTRST